MPRVIQVIETEKNRGKGTETDYMRLVKQYHTVDGELLAEYDLAHEAILIKALEDRGCPFSSYPEFPLREGIDIES